jgi:O-antigen ligase
MSQVGLRGAGTLSMLLACAGMGAMIALGPTWFPLATLGALALLLVATGSRRALRRGSFSDRTDTADQESPAPDPLATARFFYYVGLLSMAELVIRPAAHLTLSDLSFFAALILTLVHHASNRQPPRRVLPPTLVAGALLFTAGALLSLLDAESTVGTLGTLIRVLYLVFVWFWLSSALLRTPRQIRVAIGCWVASAAITSAYAVAQFLGVPGGTAEFGRFGGLTDHVNDLGGIAATTLLPALILVCLPSISFGKRLLAGGTLGIIATGLMFSGSVGGALAAFAAAAVFLISQQLTRAVVVTVLIGALGFILLAPSSGLVRSPVSRFSTVTNPASAHGGGTLETRIETYKAAWQRIEKDPIVGAGLDSRSSTMQNGNQVHNLFLGRWYEAGILGLLGITLMIWSFLASGWRAVLNARSQQELLIALGLLAAIVAFIAFGMSEPILYKRYGLAPVALMLALLAQQSARQPAPVWSRAVERDARYRGSLPARTAREDLKPA